MPHVPRWRRYARFWGPDVAADVDDELRFHLESRAEALRARGLAPAEAARVAAEEFGDVEATRRALRAIGGRLERRRERLYWWHRLRADLAYTLRGLRAAPLFTAGVVLTLAVGVGAAALMYGTMRRLLLRPPPHVAAPERLAKAYFHHEAPGDSARTFDQSSYPLYERLRAGTRTLAGAAAYQAGEELAVGAGSDAQVVRATLVSGGFWHTLGARPAVGRFIADDEAHPATGDRVVVLGHALWQRRFGGDPAAVGATLRVRGQPYRIVGIAPRGFRGVELTDTDVWLPLFAYADGDAGRATWHTFAGSFNLAFVVRPKPGVPAEQAAAELSREHAVVVAEANRPLPPQARWRGRTRVTLATLTGALGGDGRRIPEGTVSVWLVGVAVALLAIAGANVASLLLLRALRRRREFAVRRALGMSRARLAALLLGESALLAALGGTAAAAVVAWGGTWVRRVLLPGMVSESAGVDWHVLAVAIAVVAAVALLTAFVPVLHTRGDAPAALRDGAQHGAARRSRVYWGLLVAQTALSTVLLVGAGVFLRSLYRAATLDLGLDTERSHVVHVDFAGSGRSGRETAAFFERALERVRAVPGVASASLATVAPLRGAMGLGLGVRPNGDFVSGPQGASFGDWVSDGYFDATGMRMASGRGFTAADRAGPPVAVVNEALARLAWPGRSPLGQCAYLSSARETCARVVGVVRNAHTFQLREEQRLWVYAPLAPAEEGRQVLLVRAAPGVRGVDRTLRRVLRELDPALPYVDVQRLGDALDPQLRPWRLGASVFTAFGGLAALLAALGLYSAVAYAVTQRTREIGVRRALGATTPAVVRPVLGDGLRVGAAGVVAGIALALAGGRWVADLLFDTSPRDPAVLTAVAVTLLAVAAAASLAPARRAVRVHPTEALRAD